MLLTSDLTSYNFPGPKVKYWAKHWAEGLQMKMCVLFTVKSNRHLHIYCNIMMASSTEMKNFNGCKRTSLSPYICVFFSQENNLCSPNYTEEIPQVYKRDVAAHSHTNQNIISSHCPHYHHSRKTLCCSEIHYGSYHHHHCYGYYHWHSYLIFKKVQIQLFVDVIMFSTVSSFKMAIWNTSNRYLC